MVRFVFPLDPGVMQGSTPGYYLTTLQVVNKHGLKIKYRCTLDKVPKKCV